mmetsp:Transcript_11202/g.31006  ORF Transcript_11202/g.31006 Transcript_11202/m.31006 type:complete len:98 (-) Transcript_11202:30-323(-)
MLYHFVIEFTARQARAQRTWSVAALLTCCVSFFCEPACDGFARAQSGSTMSSSIRVSFSSSGRVIASQLPISILLIKDKPIVMHDVPPLWRPLLDTE